MIPPEWPKPEPGDLVLLVVETAHTPEIILTDECSGWVEIRGSWWQELRMWWANVWWGHCVRLFGRDGY